jgi:hypothetical protein
LLSACIKRSAKVRNLAKDLASLLYILVIAA